MRIRCLNREVTYQEWGELVKCFSSSEAVFRFKDFEYNLHDVCLTPHQLVVYDAESFNQWAVKTAQSPNGKWMIGWESPGATSPVLFCDDETKGYFTEREAIYECLLRLESLAKNKIAWEEKRNGNANEISGARKALAQIAILKDRYDLRQLTLF